MTTLEHCKPKKLDDDGPGAVTIVCPDGPGTVDVTGPDGEPVFGSVPVPDPGPPANQVHVPMPGAVYVHYRQDEGGPAQIEADITQS